MKMYDPRRTGTDMPLNIGALPDDVDQMRMRREEVSSGGRLPLNMRSMPDDNYVGDGDPMDDSLRGEGPYFDAIENVMSFGVPEEFAIEVAKLTPSVELLEGGVEEQREIALDLQNMLLNELSGNVDPAIEASPVEMDMRENYTR